MSALLIFEGFKRIRVPDYYMLWFSPTSGKEWLSVLFNVSSPVGSFHTLVFSFYFPTFSEAEDLTVASKIKSLFYEKNKNRSLFYIIWYHLNYSG